jgi:hypothetical protein
MLNFVNVYSLFLCLHEELYLLVTQHIQKCYTESHGLFTFHICIMFLLVFDSFYFKEPLNVKY